VYCGSHLIRHSIHSAKFVPLLCFYLDFHSVDRLESECVLIVSIIHRVVKTIVKFVCDLYSSSCWGSFVQRYTYQEGDQIVALSLQTKMIYFRVFIAIKLGYFNIYDMF